MNNIEEQLKILKKELDYYNTVHDEIIEGLGHKSFYYENMNLNKVGVDKMKVVDFNIKELENRIKHLNPKFYKEYKVKRYN